MTKREAPLRSRRRILGVLAVFVSTVLGAIYLSSSPAASRSDSGPNEGARIQNEPRGPASGSTQKRSSDPAQSRVELPEGDGPRTKVEWRTISIYTYRADTVGHVGNVRVVLTALSAGHKNPLDLVEGQTVTSEEGVKPIQVHTNSEGTAKVKIRAARLYLVRASSPGFISLGFPTTIRARTRELRIPFSKSLSVKGIVLGSNGKPLPGARLNFCAPLIRSDSNIVIGATGRARSNARGEFLLSTKTDIQGPLYLSIQHSDHAPLVEKLPPGKAYSYLVLKMTAGIRFQFRVLGSQGKPIKEASFRLVQGRYTSILKSRPGGILLDGAGKGLKTLVSVDVSPFGIARVRGWPRGVPAWFRCMVPIVGAHAVPGFDVQLARPLGLKRTSDGVFEFTPRDGQQYDVFILTQGRIQVFAECKAPKLTRAQRRELRCYFQYSDGYEFGMDIVWQDDERFRAIADYLEETIEERMKDPQKKRTFHLRFTIPRREDQTFGPFRSGIDIRIQNIDLTRR